MNSSLTRIEESKKHVQLLLHYTIRHYFLHPQFWKIIKRKCFWCISLMSFKSRWSRRSIEMFKNVNSSKDQWVFFHFLPSHVKIQFVFTMFTIYIYWLTQIQINWAIEIILKNEFTRWQKALFIHLSTDIKLFTVCTFKTTICESLIFVLSVIYMWEITCMCLTAVHTWTYTVDITVCRHIKLTETI